jgi:DeoR/GlpR family transcriptional regulator of sugar metabolism
MLLISFEIPQIYAIPKVTKGCLLGKGHRLVERRQAILATLEDAGQLSVATLSNHFDVSEVTIRQDLQALSEQGLLLRTRGGAVASNVMPELSVELRQRQQASQKARIGQAAARLVNDGDTLILDASTTAQAIIPHLKRLTEITVITNSLKTAMGFLDAPHIQVILPGGTLRRAAISLVGQPHCDFIHDIHVQVGFFGARGLTIEEGLTDVNLDESSMKRAMIERCQRVVGVLDSSKWGKVAATTIAKLDQIDTIISDTDSPTELVQQLQQHQIEVILV